MELSFVHAPEEPLSRGLGPRHDLSMELEAGVETVSSRPDYFLDVEVPLPESLRQFGASTRATATGNRKGPVIVALGGISANRFVSRTAEGAPGWWRGMVGPGCAVNPERHHIIGLDFAADASGRAAPSTVDQALILCAALDRLGIARADAIVGASYGAMVGLALAEAFPERVGKLVIISAGAEPHSASTAARELQRRLVSLGIEAGRGGEALEIARGMAMLTYRTSAEFAERFTGGLPGECPLGPSEPGAYLRARGRAFLSVMSPERFLSLSGSIDRHKIDPSRIGCPVLLIGAETDQLVPAAQMRALAAGLGGPAELHLLDCLCGHDMFLKEAEAVGRFVRPFLES